MNEDYNFEEHCHRYACWTAARAASISRFSNKEISSFINGNDLKKKVLLLRANQLSHSSYRDWFILQVNGLLQSMLVAQKDSEQTKHRSVSFGIAAKLVSIYVKTFETLTSVGSSNISVIAIPPIDSFLLKKLKRDENLLIENTAWSKMEEEEFMKLVEELKRFMGDRPFWQLEKYWDVND